MKRYHCPACQSEVFFANTVCLNCGTELLFSPQDGFSTMQDTATGPCANRNDINCNWEATAPGHLCLSCAHTTVVPDLSVVGNATRWERIETAKRGLFLMLWKLGLPLYTEDDEPAPVFELKGDPIVPQTGTEPGTGMQQVLTGHENGTITLNIAEADDAERERIRTEMGEPYRTLAGHFRHEVAHHYWDVLTADRPDRLARLREVFGDDRMDYGQALQDHYAQGAPEGWSESYISAYASSHPWEDFAETWAHVFHMLEGLETARSFVLLGEDCPDGIEALILRPMDELAATWVDFSIALNAVNRAMGHNSFYPFVLSPTVIGKLEAIRSLIAEAGHS